MLPKTVASPFEKSRARKLFEKEVIHFMKVEQYYNKNQFHMYGDDYHYLQSYNSLVVKIDSARNTNVCSPYGYIKLITLGRDWDYSKTTSRHVYMFLEEYGNVYIPHDEKNKRKYIQKLIDDDIIYYDENMR